MEIVYIKTRGKLVFLYDINKGGCHFLLEKGFNDKPSFFIIST